MSCNARVCLPVLQPTLIAAVVELRYKLRLGRLEATVTKLASRGRRLADPGAISKVRLKSSPDLALGNSVR